MAKDVSADFTVDYVNSRITHSSGTEIYTVNELYSYLQDTFDELDQLDDTIPMSAQTPTAYTLINGWFMDDDSFQFLKGGAVETDGYLDAVRILTFESADYVNAVSGDIGLTATGGTTGDTGELLAYNNTTREWWVRMDAAGDLFDQVEPITIPTGTGAGTTTGASVTGEDLWPNVYTLGTILEDDNQQIYIMQDGARAFSGSEWWPENLTGTQHMDILFKVKEAGTEIDAGNITVFLRHWDTVLPGRGNADLYDHFEIDLSAGGRNAVPLASAADLNNTTDDDVVATYNDITVAFVNGTIDYSAISGTFTDFETVTGSTSGATAIFLYSTTVTGSGTMTLGNINGTFQSGETLSGASETAAASSTVTAEYTMSKAFSQGSSYPYSVIVNCETRTLAQVYEYFKYVTRVGNTFTTYPTTTDDTATTWTTVQGQLYIRAHEDGKETATNTFSPVKASPFGTFAGGTLFGAQGVWVENMAAADVQAFQLIDSNGTTRTPPNQVTITVSNTLSTDRVAVFRTTGGQGSTTIDKALFTSHAADNTTGNSAFIIQEAIPSDTPTSGSLRAVETANTSSTREKRYLYTGWTTSTFTGVSPTLDRAYSGSDTIYVPFLDDKATATTISQTVIFNTDRYVLVRVRRKEATAILPFETTGQVTSAGYTVATIRTTDSIVT